MINRGDKCWVQLNKKHYGVCTGIGSDGALWFVHNTREGGVVHSTRKGFAGNREITVEQRAARGHADAIVNRAVSLVGRDYAMLSVNCEHVANLAANGAAESKQVREGAATAGLAMVFLSMLTAVVNQNGTSVTRCTASSGRGSR